MRQTVQAFGALAVVILLFALLAVSFERREQGSEAPSAGRDVASISSDLIERYVDPVQDALALIDPECKTRLDAQSESCSAFVSTIMRVDPELESIGSHVEAFLDSPPEGATPQLIRGLQATLDETRVSHESNLLLIEGWAEANEAKWQEGWDLRAASGNEFVP